MQARGELINFSLERLTNYPQPLLLTGIAITGTMKSLDNVGLVDDYIESQKRKVRGYLIIAFFVGVLVGRKK